MSQTPTIPTLPDESPDGAAALAYATPRRMPRLQSFRIVWPVVALSLLLAFNAVFTTGFFRMGLNPNGQLYGTPVDVLHYASPIVLLAMGMTLVIATGGVDLSVGATMAIARRWRRCW